MYRKPNYRRRRRFNRRDYNSTGKALLTVARTGRGAGKFVYGTAMHASTRNRPGHGPRRSGGTRWQYRARGNAEAPPYEFLKA